VTAAIQEGKEDKKGIVLGFSMYISFVAAVVGDLLSPS
jgi:hypothetical protein